MNVQRYAVTIWFAALALVAGLISTSPVSAQIANPLKLSVMTLNATADMGTVTFAYAFKSVNRSASVGMQLFVHHTDSSGADEWPQVWATDQPGGTLVVQLYKGLTATGTFTAHLTAGNYGECRVLFFDCPDGHNPDWTKAVYDSAEKSSNLPDVNLHFTVATSQVRVTELGLVTGNADIEPDGAGTYTVTIPAKVQIPAFYTGKDTGFWAMAQGSGGFSQVWADIHAETDSGDLNDHFKQIPVLFRLEKEKEGIFNVNFGLFTSDFNKKLVWQWPGLDFEVGGDSWVVRAPANAIPPRIHVKDRKFVADDGTPYNFYPDDPGAMDVGFVRGGDYGNTLDREIFPQLDTVGYFVDLRETGCRYIRVIFTGDRYGTEPLYEHAVDQVVQNIMAAGIYPLIAPQDLPKGKSLSDRIEKGMRVVQAMARKYKGLPVWIEVDNEPHDFGAWSEWKPIAERYVKAVRAIDPDAFVVVPFEGWSKDGRAAAADPITSTTVDLYDGHAYIDPASIATCFGAAGRAGLPVLIGEYGGSPAYLHKMDLAFQAEGHALMAVSPWAFTVAGQDQLPLIKDGSTAVLQFTDAGQVIASDFAKWNEGKRLTEDVDLSELPANLPNYAKPVSDPAKAPSGSAVPPAPTGDMGPSNTRTVLLVALPTAAAGVAVGIAIGRRLPRRPTDPT